METQHLLTCKYTIPQAHLLYTCTIRNKYIVNPATLVSNNITYVEISSSKYRVAQKTSRNLCNYNGTYTSWGEISFGTFVDQYVLLLAYKFQ